MNEPVTPERFSSRHRWQVAWALTWPWIPFDLIDWLLIRSLRRHFDAQSIAMIYAIYSVLIFFLIAPWIVHRVVRLNFRDFYLVAIRRSSGEETRALSYRESLSVAWLLTWRSGVVIGLVFAFLGFWASRGGPTGLLLVPRFGLVVSTLLSLLLFYLWLVSAAIRKTYSDFVIQLRETGH